MSALDVFQSLISTPQRGCFSIILAVFAAKTCPCQAQPTQADHNRIVCPDGRELFTNSVSETGCQTPLKPTVSRPPRQGEQSGSSDDGDSSANKLTASNGKITSSVEFRDFFRERKSRGGVARVPYCEFAGLARSTERQRVVVQILDGELPVSIKQIEVKPNRAATPWRLAVRGRCASRRARIAPFRS